MYLADTLSRAPLSRNNEVLSIEKEIEQIWMVDFLPIHSLEDICRESLKDNSIQALQKVIKSRWPETKNDLPAQVKPYFDVRDQLSVEDRIVFYGDRCLIPVSLRPEVLAKIHRSHIGIEGCLRRTRESVFWPGMTAALKNHVNWYDVCRTFEMSQQKEKLHPHEVPHKPWSKVAVDLFEFSNRHYLVTVDYYSNFWEVDRMESSTMSKAVISKLKQYFPRHGIPDKVVSGNGPQFNSDKF